MLANPSITRFQHGFPPQVIQSRSTNLYLAGTQLVQEYSKQPHGWWKKSCTSCWYISHHLQGFLHPRWFSRRISGPSNPTIPQQLAVCHPSCPGAIVGSFRPPTLYTQGFQWLAMVGWLVGWPTDLGDIVGLEGLGSCNWMQLGGDSGRYWLRLTLRFFSKKNYVSVVFFGDICLATRNGIFWCN